MNHHQLLTSYEQPNTPLMNEKLPGIDKLPKLDENGAPSPPAPMSFIDNSDKQIYAYLPPPPSSLTPGIVYEQHMTPPLTPAVSPSSILLDPMHFKRKFSVDVGPFGFGTTIPHPPVLSDQDAYRRSSCSSVSMDLIQQQQQQQQQQQEVDYSFLDSDNSNHAFTQNKPSEVRRGSRAHMNGPATQHKHVCKYPYCNWSFKRYEHLKRHILVHTGKRPHVCHYPGCGKSFSRSDNFHAHYRTHMKKANNIMSNTKKVSTTSKTSSSQQQNPAATAAAVAAVAAAAAAAASVSSSMATPSPQVYDPHQSFDMVSYQDMYSRPSHHFEDNNTGYVQHSYLRTFNQEEPQHNQFNAALDGNSSPGSLLDHEIGGSQDQHCFYTTSTPQHTYITSIQGEHYGYNYTNNDSIAAAASVVAVAASSANKGGRKSNSNNNNNDNNNNKSHACPVLQCQRRFKRLEHLKRHMRIHTLERPFSCSFPNCHKTFSRSDNLSQHMKTHQRVQYPRRKQKQQQQTEQQEEQQNTMISNMVDMSWHSAGTVGC